LFVDGDPLKGGYERCSDVEASAATSRTVATAAAQKE